MHDTGDQRKRSLAISWDFSSPSIMSCLWRWRGCTSFDLCVASRRLVWRHWAVIVRWILRQPAGHGAGGARTELGSLSSYSWASCRWWLCVATSQIHMTAHQCQPLGHESRKLANVCKSFQPSSKWGKLWFFTQPACPVTAYLSLLGTFGRCQTCRHCRKKQ